MTEKIRSEGVKCVDDERENIENTYALNFCHFGLGSQVINSSSYGPDQHEEDFKSSTDLEMSIRATS